MGLLHTLWPVATSVELQFSAAEWSLMALVAVLMSWWSVRVSGTSSAAAAVAIWLLLALVALVLGRQAALAFLATSGGALALRALPGGLHPDRSGLRHVAHRWFPLVLGLALSVALPREFYGTEFFLSVLAFIGSDTLATETGVRLGGRPRAVLSGRRGERGASGYISLVGIVAGLAGAVLPIFVFRWQSVVDGGVLPLEVRFFGAVGFLGMLVDSILGATVQRREYGRTDNPPTGASQGEDDLRAGQVSSQGLSNDGVDSVTALLIGVFGVLAYECILPYGME